MPRRLLLLSLLSSHSLSLSLSLSLVMALRDEEDQAIKLFGSVIAPSLRKEKRVLSHSQEVLGSHSEEHEQSLGGMDDSTVPSSMGTNVVWEEEEGDRKFLLNANNNNNDKQVLASSCYSEMDVVQCPRCNSRETKFCYFNNYNPKQPRHFCRACQRYWTAGGNLRNVPIGAGRRKSKRPHTQTNNNNHPYPPSSPPINDNNTLLIRRDSTDYTAAADLSTKEITRDTEEESGGLATPLEPSSFIERGNIPLLDSSSSGGFYAGPPPLAPPPMMPWPFPGAMWNPYQLGGAIFPWMMMPWMAGANMLPPPPAFFPPPGPNIPEEGSVPLPPKTLRIGDPGAVLQSDFPGFFSAFHPPPQFFQKNLLPTTTLFPETPLKPEYSNPVAFSRSVAFQESN